jgi:DNA invertase Pin-like site-specific DNA recombinase
VHGILGGGKDMNIGYARVSTREQNVALQVDALKAAGCGKVLTEIAIGGAARDRAPA